jgi:hypothetical protein
MLAAMGAVGIEALRVEVGDRHFVLLDGRSVRGIGPVFSVSVETVRGTGKSGETLSAECLLKT